MRLEAARASVTFVAFNDACCTQETEAACLSETSPTLSH